MNNSTSDTAHSDLNTTIVDIVEIILIPLYFLLAVVYVIIILSQKSLRSNKLNWPTVNIALTTAFFAVNHFLLVIIHFAKVSSISCRLVGFFTVMAACQMMYAYCVSSINRVLAIRYFHKYLFGSSKWLLTTMTIGWIIAALFPIPHALYNTIACVPNEATLLLNIYNSIITLFIPINIVTICNISIFRYINRISRRIHDHNNKNNSNMSRKRDAHVSKMMLLTFSFFVIGWAPIIFEELYTSPDRQLPTSLTKFFGLLLPISLLGEMIVLLYANQSIRQVIREKFHWN